MIEELYQRAKTTPGDFHEHVAVLRALAEECVHVTEFGTRTGVSTTALVAARPSVVRAYDLERLPPVDELERAAREAGVDFTLTLADTRTMPVIERTDLLFVDTAHNYRQLRAELRRHADRVAHFLAFHDTTTFGDRGDGHPSAEGDPRGLWHAVDEFLRERPEWRLVERRHNCHGFTWLERIG